MGWRDTAEPHVHVEEEEVGGANLADAEIAENVDRVVGVEEGAGKRHICNVLDAWRAEKSGGGVVKEIVECGHLLLLEIGHKHDGTRSDEIN